MPEAARIYPQTPKAISASDLSTDDKSEGHHGCLGTVIWITSCVVCFVVLSSTNIVEKTHWLVWFSPFLVASWVTTAAIEALRDKVAAKVVATKNQRFHEESEKESQNVTSSAHHCYSQSFDDLKRLEADVWLAREALSKARSEYSANAFSPFWDLIEKAVSHIADYKGHLDSMRYNAEQYENLLKNRRHTFPPYPIDNKALPDLRHVIREFHDTVRLGQTNFHFALIWEQRRTREVLITGFKTFGDAVQNIGSSLDRSLTDFEKRLADLLRRMKS